MNTSTCISSGSNSVPAAVPKERHLPRLRQPASALTHLAGLIAVLLASAPLMAHAAWNGASRTEAVTLYIFLLSMSALYLASASYHALDLGPAANRALKRADHLTIFLLIAGTYTPFCVITLPRRQGILLLAVIWILAAAGMTVKYFFVYCPRWVSSVIYIAMGWACVFFLPAFYRNLPRISFLLLFLGGIAYSAGAVIYALKLTDFNERHPVFGTHEIFHVFVMLGSLFHYLSIWTLF